ncbi:MAG: hypothetical protein H0U63_01825, partial [Burkholderiales bacterium]|nr:hypothetical protein [Burkholderiales bacterium]
MAATASTAFLISAIVLTAVVPPLADPSAGSDSLPRAAYQQQSERKAIAEIAVDELPVEARNTLRLIAQSGPFPYARDGVAFRNRERRLPRRQRGYYREYTVPTPAANDRGARRIIAGAAGDYYYSDDHYRS